MAPSSPPGSHPGRPNQTCLLTFLTIQAPQRISGWGRARHEEKPLLKSRHLAGFKSSPQSISKENFQTRLQEILHYYHLSKPRRWERAAPLSNFHGPHFPQTGVCKLSLQAEPSFQATSGDMLCAHNLLPPELQGKTEFCPAPHRRVCRPIPKDDIV